MTAIAEEAQLEAAAIAVYGFVTGDDWHVNGDRWFHAASTAAAAGRRDARRGVAACLRFARDTALSYERVTITA